MVVYSMEKIFLMSVLFFFKKKFFLAAPCGLWDLSSQIRDCTWVPYSGSSETQPLDHQGNPNYVVYINPKLCSLYKSKLHNVVRK